MFRIKKLYHIIKLFFNSVFYGMKGVDTVLATNQKSQDGSVIEVSDEFNDSVFKDILEERVTQEVEELRYSSYKVANESKKYRYVGNGKVIKKKDSQLSEKHGLIDESDNLRLVLIQDNKQVCEDVLTILNEIDKKYDKKVFSDYTIKVKREIFPRFLIESYISKVVVKESDENYVLDLYCSKYPSQFSEKKDRAFISEIKRIKDGFVRNSDILDIEEISFISSNAWGVDDWFKFSFNDFEFYDIIEFDGNYIIRMGCKSNVFMENILDKIYSDSADEKYKNKEIRKNVTTDFTSYVKNDDYIIDDSINLDVLENVNFSIENNN